MKSTKGNTMETGSECFNCFQRGRCGYRILFTKSDPPRKPLHFCSIPCRDAHLHSEVIPKYMANNQERINMLNEVMTEIKSFPAEFMKKLGMKKVFATELILRTSIVNQKPKAELQRLYALWQECASDTLTAIMDRGYQDQTMLDWVDIMKDTTNYLPAMIEGFWVGQEGGGEV